MKTNLLLRLCFSMVPVFLFSFETQSQVFTQGPNSPSVVEEQFAGCLACPGASWWNPMEAMTADSQYTFTQLGTYPWCFNGTCYFSRALMAEDFAFQIPSNATISGIKTEVIRMASSPQFISDTLIQLISAGQPIGINMARQNAWPTVLSTEIYGDSSNLWGSAWTPAQINAPDFGFYLMPRNKDTSASLKIAMVDHIQITVYYQLPSGIIESQQSDELFTATYHENETSLLIRSKISNFQIAELHVYDAVGNICFQADYHSMPGMHFEKQISTTTFRSGIYLINLSIDKKQSTRKVRID